MKYFLLVTVLLLPGLSNGQSLQKEITKIDSLLAIPAADQALLKLEEVNRSHTDAVSAAILSNKKGEILIIQGKLDDAEKILEQLQAKGFPNAIQQAVYLTNLGFLQLNKGRHDLAIENLRKAYTIFQSENQGYSKESARCLTNLSLTYMATGKYNQAIENGLIALQIRQSQYGPQHEEVAAAYNDLGLAYSQVNPDQSLEYYEKALVIYQKIHGREHPKIAIANGNIGLLYQGMELYGDAINNLEAALKIWKTIYPAGHPNQAFVLRNLGQTYVRMGNNKTALTYLEQALEQYKKSYGGKHPDIASTLNQIGKLRLGDREFDAALSISQQALAANIPSFQETNTKINPPINDYYNPTVLLFSLRLKAQVLEEIHFGKTLNFSDLELALSTLYLCDSLIDDIRHHSTDESDKIALGTIASDVYEDGVRIAGVMSEMTLKPKYYLQAAFYFAEKSKSAVLQESIADSQAKSFAGIPQTLLDEETNLKTTIAFLAQKLSQKPPAEEEKYLRESLFALNHEYTAFTTRLEKDYPNYFNLKFNTSFPKVQDLQKLLTTDQAIVSYFVAEKSKRIYQFIITSSSFKSSNSTLPDDFDRLTKGFNNGIYYRDFNTYVTTAKPLKRILRPAVPGRVKELIVIPSGRLGTMPLEALPLKASPGKSFASTKYLVHRFAISYEFSAGLIGQKSKSSSAPTSPNIFLCAPVTFPEKDNLNELPGTETEVATISNLFPAGATQVKLRAEANESTVKSDDISKYNYLHFATHGVVDETDPELSRIYLNENTAEDGHLYAGEIYNLNLNANLAVLSACQTGLGKYSKGEGVIGLSRALVYAGAKNLVVSFWSVADESTAQLMTNFYDHLLHQGSENFKVALQKAKVNMAGSTTFSDPYYWAPFVLIGF